MSDRHEYDYVVVGGGSAGAIVAARLAEGANTTVCLVEAGPTDEGKPEILELQRWPELLHSEYDYGYRIEPQERGNSDIVQSRGRVLGGSSSHNICQAWRAPDHDLRDWEAAGATGWGPDGTCTYFDRVLERTGLDYTPPDNDAAAAFIEAGKQAGYPERKMEADANREGVGWVALNSRNGTRQSSSVAYLHRPPGPPSNLTVMTDTQTFRLVFDEQGENVSGVETNNGTLYARQEVIVSCGSFDSPKLLMLSGIGPEEHLRELGIPVRANLPVGEHLLDHPEGGVVYETNRPIHQPHTVYCDAVLLANVEEAGTEWPELMVWFFSGHFESFTSGAGGERPSPEGVTAFSIAPDVLHSRAEGYVRLRSADPADPPVINPRYFTDPDGWDERMVLAGIKLARKIAEQPALASWIEREVEPGPDVQSDEELSEYARKTSYTAYHPAGTCRMGASDDPNVVVDPELRVRGIGGLRVADASIFPTLPGCNPNITCMMVGEKCADLIRGQS